MLSPAGPTRSKLVTAMNSHSLAILWGSLAALNVGVTELASSYGSGFRLAFLAPGDTLAVVLFSAGLGWLGAYMSVSRYLLEIEPK